MQNKQIVGMLENIHLLRKLFVKRASEDSPLHFGQIAIMKCIEQNENCNQADLAELLGVTPASVAVSTKRLQKAGLLRKETDPDNLRCKRLTLTDEGRKAIESRIRIFEEYDQLIFGSFSEEEKAQLMEFLGRIAGKMQEIEGIEGDFSSPMELGCLLHKKMEENQ
ncbi:MAG TPA: MarR family transcriptional regulator [Ruminococcus sp.]|nr:MarR family transcriptional regulator [Ruminococcus sp.]